MKILRHGGGAGVTGSCHRLQIAPGRVLLVDCGIFQGQDAEHLDSLEQHQVRFPPETELLAGDILVFIGAPECARELRHIHGLKPASGDVHKLDARTLEPLRCNQQDSVLNPWFIVCAQRDERWERALRASLPGS